MKALIEKVFHRIKILILFFFVALKVQAQTNFYVSPSGDDNNSGSLSNPFK